MNLKTRVNHHLQRAMCAAQIVQYGIAALAMLLLAAACAAPQNTASQPLAIENAWARPGIAGQNSAIYLVVKNPNPAADHLIGIRGDAAAMLELHRSQMDENGVMKMVQQEKIEVPARGKLELKPGDYHIMLMGLKQDLNFGDTLQVTLIFETAGEITLTVPVGE